MRNYLFEDVRNGTQFVVKTDDLNDAFREAYEFFDIGSLEYGITEWERSLVYDGIQWIDIITDEEVTELENKGVVVW